MACEKRDCDLEISLKDWLRDVETICSKVPIRCRKCRHKCKSTDIHHFIRGILGCRCKNKCENIVRGFLEEVFGKDRILDGRVDWCVNPVTNYKLPFDMIIGDWKIIIDVDGEQHFKDIKIFKSGLTLEERKKRDKLKEGMANENGYSVIRVDQMDVQLSRNN